MPQAKGSDAVFALYEETTYATVPGTPDGKKLYLRSFGVRATRPKIDSETLTGERVRGKPVDGNWDVQGDLVGELSPESFGTLLKHAIGSSTPSGAGPYVHTITPGALPVGLMLEKDHGSAISGAGRVEQFLGCRVSSMRLQYPVEGFILVTFSMRGSGKFAQLSALTDGTLTDSGHKPFASPEITLIEEGGSAIATIRELDITLENDLDDGLYVLGGGGTRRSLPEGFSTPKSSITALFESAALLTKAKDSTETSLKITLSRGDGLGSAGNESLEMFLSKMQWAPTSPEITGPRGVLLTLEGTAYRVSAGSDAIQAVLKNALATI